MGIENKDYPLQPMIIDVKVAPKMEGGYVFLKERNKVEEGPPPMRVMADEVLEVMYDEFVRADPKPAPAPVAEEFSLPNYPAPPVGLKPGRFSEFAIHGCEVERMTPTEAGVEKWVSVLGWHERYEKWIVVQFMEGMTKLEREKAFKPRYGNGVDLRADQVGDNLKPYVWIEGRIIHYGQEITYWVDLPVVSGFHKSKPINSRLRW